MQQRPWWLIPVVIGGLVWFLDPFPILRLVGIGAAGLGIVAGLVTWNTQKTRNVKP